MSHTINTAPKPWYPCTFSVGSNCTITLTADGGWSGDVGALRQAMTDGKGGNGEAADASKALLWLILREIERDQRAFDDY